MSTLIRYKKDPDGFRKLVELMETTPPSRRQKMIDVGREEDPEYMGAAIGVLLSFDDILMMPEGELMELIPTLKPQTIAACIHGLGEDSQQPVLQCVPNDLRLEVDSFRDVDYTNTEIGNARLACIKAARALEKAGKVKTRAISVALEAEMHRKYSS